MSLRAGLEARLGCRLGPCREADLRGRGGADRDPQADLWCLDGFVYVRWHDAVLDQMVAEWPGQSSDRSRALERLVATFPAPELPPNPDERALLVGLEQVQAGFGDRARLRRAFEAYYRRTPLAREPGRLARALRICRALG